MSKQKKSKKIWNIIVGGYEMTGSLFGMLISLMVIPQLLEQQLPSAKVILFIFFIVAFGLYTYIFWAGFQLWDGKKEGIKKSIIAQAIQLPKLFVGRFSYIVVSGFGSFISYSKLEGFKVNFLFGSLWKLNIGLSGTIDIGINVVALMLLFYLLNKLNLTESDSISVKKLKATFQSDSKVN